MASGDKIRYQDEMKSYVPPSPSALVAAGKDKPVKKKKVEASAAEKKSTMSAEFVDSDED